MQILWAAASQGILIRNIHAFHSLWSNYSITVRYLCLWTSDPQKSYHSEPNGPTVCSSIRIHWWKCSSHFVPLFQRWDSLHSDSLRALPPLGLTRPSPTIFPLDCYHIILTSTWAHIIYNIYPCHVFKQFHHLRISISDLAMSNIPSLRGLSL